MSNGRSTIVDIDVHIHHKTDKAALVSTDGDSDNAEWLPFSQCEIEEKPGSTIAVLSCEEWLAVEKGFV
mgnify:CR=1 FL=1